MCDQENCWNNCYIITATYSLNPSPVISEVCTHMCTFQSTCSYMRTLLSLLAAQIVNLFLQTTHPPPIPLPGYSAACSGYSRSWWVLSSWRWWWGWGRWWWWWWWWWWWSVGLFIGLLFTHRPVVSEWPALASEYLRRALLNQPSPPPRYKICVARTNASGGFSTSGDPCTVRFPQNL